jgi:hypothetical protein
MLALLLTHWPILLAYALIIVVMICDLKLDLIRHQEALADWCPELERRGRGQ